MPAANITPIAPAARDSSDSLSSAAAAPSSSMSSSSSSSASAPPGHSENVRIPSSSSNDSAASSAWSSSSATTAVLGASTIATTTPPPPVPQSTAPRTSVLASRIAAKAAAAAAPPADHAALAASATSAPRVSASDTLEHFPTARFIISHGLTATAAAADASSPPLPATAVRIPSASSPPRSLHTAAASSESPSFADGVLGYLSDSLGRRTASSSSRRASDALAFPPLPSAPSSSMPRHAPIDIIDSAGPRRAAAADAIANLSVSSRDDQAPSSSAGTSASRGGFASLARFFGRDPAASELSAGLPVPIPLPTSRRRSSIAEPVDASTQTQAQSSPHPAASHAPVDKDATPIEAGAAAAASAVPSQQHHSSSSASDSAGSGSASDVSASGDSDAEGSESSGLKFAARVPATSTSHDAALSPLRLRIPLDVPVEQSSVEIAPATDAAAAASQFSSLDHHGVQQEPVFKRTVSDGALDVFLSHAGQPISDEVQTVPKQDTGSTEPPAPPGPVATADNPPSLDLPGSPAPTVLPPVAIVIAPTESQRGTVSRSPPTTLRRPPPRPYHSGASWIDPAAAPQAADHHAAKAQLERSSASEPALALQDGHGQHTPANRSPLLSPAAADSDRPDRRRYLHLLSPVGRRPRSTSSRRSNVPSSPDASPGLGRANSAAAAASNARASAPGPPYLPWAAGAADELVAAETEDAQPQPQPRAANAASAAAEGVWGLGVRLGDEDEDEDEDTDDLRTSGDTGHAVVVATTAAAALRDPDDAHLDPPPRQSPARSPLTRSPSFTPSYKAPAAAAAAAAAAAPGSPASLRSFDERARALTTLQSERRKLRRLRREIEKERSKGAAGTPPPPPPPAATAGMGMAGQVVLDMDDSLTVKREFLLKLARSFAMYGAPTHRLEYHLAQ
ncbi:hypothetical protein HK405_004450, partial [Cladochytrium tenue]